MEEIVYNKLVRDNIPEIIENNGEKPIFSTLDDVSFKKCLEEKLFEECHEVVDSFGDERVLELADVLEIIRTLALLENKSLDDVIELANQIVKKRGGFKKKIFLENVIN